MMSSTCFEPEGSPAGRRLYVQVWYWVFYMHPYKHSSRWKSVFNTEQTLSTVFLRMIPRFRNM